MSTLFIGLVAGAVGTVYFIYGKRQSRPVSLIAGALLVVAPFVLEL